MKRRSIGLPLTIGIVLIGVAVALAVGWQILVVADLRPVAAGLTGVHWVLLILGWLFFTLLIAGLLLICVWLVREMRCRSLPTARARGVGCGFAWDRSDYNHR